MMNVGLEHYLTVSAILFSLGLLGVLVRRNLLVIYMSLELMLNAANLAFVALSRFTNNINGQVMVFFIITVAAAEVAVGLGLIVALFRKKQTPHVGDFTAMKFSRAYGKRNFSVGNFAFAAVRGGNHRAVHAQISGRERAIVHRSGRGFICFNVGVCWSMESGDQIRDDDRLDHRREFQYPDGRGDR